MEGRQVNRWLSLIVCVILASGCGGASDIVDPPLSLDGRWRGSGPNSAGGTITVDVTLSESGGMITGNGTIVGTSSTPGAGSTLVILVNGSFSSPSVSLQFTSPPGANPSISGAFTFAGILNASQIPGLYQNSIAITLMRLPS